MLAASIFSWKNCCQLYFNQNISIQNSQFVAEHHNVHSKALQIAKLAVKHIAQN